MTSRSQVGAAHFWDVGHPQQLTHEWHVLLFVLLLLKRSSDMKSVFKSFCWGAQVFNSGILAPVFLPPKANTCLVFLFINSVWFSRHMLKKNWWLVWKWAMTSLVDDWSLEDRYFCGRSRTLELRGTLLWDPGHRVSWWYTLVTALCLSCRNSATITAVFKHYKNWEVNTQHSS